MTAAQETDGMIKLLFTGVGRRIELLQAFRDASIALNKPIGICGTDVDETAPALAFCDETRIVPTMADTGYVDHLLRICAEEQIRCVIPTIDTDLLTLSENRERFRAIGTDVLISEPDVIRLCRDKMKTLELFRYCGLRFPQTVTDHRDYAGAYPAFIKPRTGSASKDSFFAEDEEALAFYAKRVPDRIIQPFIRGREYTVDVFCDRDGNVVSVVPRERLQVRSSEVLKTRISMNAEIIGECRKLCETVRFFGPLTVQLIRDADDIDWFIEINPRYGGGAPLSMKAGARSAQALLRLLDGEDAGEYAIEDGAVFSRFDQSVRVRTAGMYRNEG